MQSKLGWCWWASTPHQPHLFKALTVNGEPLEFVQNFTYLASLISKDNGGQKDIKARLGKARCAFAKLQNIWKSNQYTTKTKIILYNSNVKSTLLYGSECWRVVKGDMAFHNGCLRKICRIFWPNKISNVDIYMKTGCNSAVLEIKRRRLRWLGHVLRMPTDSPKWHWDGHHLEKGREKDGQRWRGDKQWWPSWERWGCRGVRLRPQLRTGPCGERLLWPYVPLGTKRISKSK